MRDVKNFTPTLLENQAPVYQQSLFDGFRVSADRQSGHVQASAMAGVARRGPASDGARHGLDSVTPGLSNPHKWAQHSFTSNQTLKTFIYRNQTALNLGVVGLRDSGNITRFHIGASLIESRKYSDALSSYTYKGGGCRSVVSGFSASSRRRLMQQLAKVRRDAVPIFLTLTYPNEWPLSPQEWKRHLHNFRRRFVRAYPQVSMIWKLEPQRRGAPHFHLFVFGIDTIEVGFRQWLSETWYQVVASGDEKHLRAGTRVEYLRNIRGAFSYAAKYMGKAVENREEWERPGRFWGVYGRDNLPVGVVFDVPLSWLEATDLHRFLRRYAKLPASGRPMLRVFVECPERWLDVLDICGFP